MFYVKTNFGHIYEWTKEQVAEDYANTAIQFEDSTKTKEELYNAIISDDEWLSQWFSDNIEYDLDYAMRAAKLVAIDREEERDFWEACVRMHGNVK